MTSVSLISSTAQPVDPVEQLAQRALDPKTAAALNTILDHMDLIALLVSSLDSLISRGDTITESLSAGVTELRTATKQSAGAGQMIRLLASESQPVDGIRGLLKALKDPDVSRTIGFVVTAAKTLGKELDK